MIIKVLGPGCSTDLREIMALGVLATPAVVIDGGIMCTGRVPSAEEVRGWLGA